MSVITGSLLGDGWLTKQKYGHSAFIKGQCNAHLEYLAWHLQVFDGRVSPIRSYDNPINGKVFKKNILRVQSHPTLSKLRKEWYPGGKKTIPHTLSLDPLAVAIWFFDDGDNSLTSRRASFSTNSFSTDDVEFLASKMSSEFNIHCRTNSRNQLIVKSESYKNIIDLIKPYMLWPCFEHKVSYREPKSRKITKEHSQSILQWYRDGKTMEWISLQVGVSISHVSSFLRKHLADGPLALDNTSGVKGVFWDKSRDRWVASHRQDGKTIRLGRFKSKEEAAQVVHAASTL